MPRSWLGFSRRRLLSSSSSDVGFESWFRFYVVGTHVRSILHLLVRLVFLLMLLACALVV
jgi:hypothetical protein